MQYEKYSIEQIKTIFSKIGDEKILDLILRGVIEVIVRPISRIITVGKILVDYDQSVDDSIKVIRKNTNNLFEADDMGDKKFPSTESGKKEVEFKLFCFLTKVSSYEVISEMKQKGYRPATLKELLSLEEKYYRRRRLSEEDDRNTVALGSIVRFKNQDCVCAIRLHTNSLDDDWKRSYGLHYACYKEGGFIWLPSGWGTEYQFLAVPI